LRAEMVADWWTAMYHGHDRGEGGEQPPVMIAARHIDVDDLNVRARARMTAVGGLGPDTITVAGREFAVGDQAIALRNHRKLDLDNGTRGVVIAVDPASGSLWLHTEEGRTLWLPAWYLQPSRWSLRRRIDHAYAITCHKAEGMTCDRTFVLGSDLTLFKEWGYVALSRGRLENRIYLALGDHHLSEELDLLPAPPQDLVEVATQALQRSRTQHLALDHQRLPHQSPAHPPGAPATRTRRGAANAGTDASRIRTYQRELQAWLLDANERLAGDHLRRRHRRLEAAAHTAERLLASLDHQLDEVANCAPGPPPTAEGEHSTQGQAAETLSLLDGQSLAERLEADPPRYLLAELGGLPATEQARCAWRAAALQIEAYRQANHVYDPLDALGPDSGDRARQSQRQRLIHQVEAARDLIEAAEHLAPPAHDLSDMIGIEL